MKWIIEELDGIEAVEGVEANPGADPPVHRGFKTLCWVPVRDLAITMHFFGVNGFLWLKLSS